MADTKVSALAAITTATAADAFYILNEGSTSNKITFANMEASISYDNILDTPTTITPTQSSNILTNNSKVSFDWDFDANDLINVPTTITTAQASAIVANTAKTSFTWDYDYTDLINKPTTISSAQASAITANTAKVTYSGLASDHGTAATDQIVNVCYGTGLPPTANTTTIGALFVKYTA